MRIEQYMSMLSMRKKPYYVVSSLLVIVLAAVVLINMASTMASTGEPAQTGGEQEPVVLELFTSQGCSSCPPADAFLQELASDPDWGDKVIPLAFHVDYWNYLGWKDPFSKPAWTERQGDYVTAMGGATLYTPQLVIHGREETVGVRKGEIRKYIETVGSLSESHALDIDFVSMTLEEGELKGEIAVSGVLPAGKSNVRLWGILFERSHDTAIVRGENAGKTLKNDYIVRNMVDLGQLQRASTSKEIHQGGFLLHLPVTHALTSTRYGIVVLAQDVSTMAMFGASVQML